MSLGILVWEGWVSCDYTHKHLHAASVMEAKESTKRETALNACLMEHFYSHSKTAPQRPSQCPQAGAHECLSQFLQDDV